MIFRRPAPAPSETPAPTTEAEVLLEHANIMRKLGADMASQHLTLMLVGDGSPMNNLVRDTVGAKRQSMEEAADHLQRLARESRIRPPGLTMWQFVLRLGLAFAVGITIAPFSLMALFWAIDQIVPRRPIPPQLIERGLSPVGAPAATRHPASPTINHEGETSNGAR